MENTKVSSVVRVALYAELLAKDIRTLAHPASIHEMQRQLDLAVQDLKVNVMTQVFSDMVAIGLVSLYGGKS
jgi:hypothetical protein